MCLGWRVKEEGEASRVCISLRLAYINSHACFLEYVTAERSAVYIMLGSGRVGYDEFCNVIFPDMDEDVRDLTGASITEVGL